MSSIAGTSSAIVVSGYHQLSVQGYSLSRDVTTGTRITSPAFHVAGHTWHVNLFPNGDSDETAGFVSVYLVLDDDVIEAVEAQFEFSIVGIAETQAPPCIRDTEVYAFEGRTSWGCSDFIGREELEKSQHLKDDCFTVRCDMAIIVRHCSVESTAPSPPSHLHRHLGDLLLSQGFGADVRFHVGGQTFAAHRCVLAARSPVFRAELFGAMRDSNPAGAIGIYDMDARVFGAFLWFIYTGTLPEMNEPEAAETAVHLLAAADRFGIEGLKAICEDRLSRHINVSSAAVILALAEQYQCRELKEACFGFIKFSTNLNAVMATNGFEHLARTCPVALRELIAKIDAGC